MDRTLDMEIEKMERNLDMEIKKKKRRNLDMEMKSEIEEIDSIDPSTLNYAMEQEKLFDALQSFEDTQGTKMNN